MMTEVHQPKDYYVVVDDGDHMYFVSNNEHIFDALANYYDTINQGPDDGISTSRWLEVEMGELVSTSKNEEMEPILYHEFTEIN